MRSPDFVLESTSTRNIISTDHRPVHSLALYDCVSENIYRSSDNFVTQRKNVFYFGFTNGQHLYQLRPETFDRPIIALYRKTISMTFLIHRSIFFFFCSNTVQRIDGISKKKKKNTYFTRLALIKYPPGQWAMPPPTHWTYVSTFLQQVVKIR